MSAQLLVLACGLIWCYREAMAEYPAHQFAMLNDSNVVCRYLLIPHDTLGKAYNPFEGSAWTDSMRLAYPSGIYPVTKSQFFCH